MKILRDRDKPSVLHPIDEALVVTAIFHSLLYCQPTIVLTRDNDVIEQWCKCIYLIDTHYQAMLVADEYASRPSRFTTVSAPKCEELYHDSENVLLNAHFAMHELRSQGTPPIQSSCGLLSTSDNPLIHSQRSFGLVKDMSRLLDVKGRTRGRNTELFGEKNMHVELDPRRVRFRNSGPALVNESTIATQNPEDFPISVTDSELAIFTKEQFSEMIFHPMDDRTA